MSVKRRSLRLRRFSLCLAAAAILGAAAGLLPALPNSLRRAGVASLAFSMPEGTFSLLQKRFLPQALPEDAEDPGESAGPSVTPLPPVGTGESPLPFAGATGEKTDSGPPIETIAPENRGTITEQQFTGGEGALYLPLENGFLKNFTELSPQAVRAELEQPLALCWEDTRQPQVLIFHTHATESYEPYDRDFCDTSYTWRSTDNRCNMAAVGDFLAAELEKAGIRVIHDVTQHDYPSYNGSYQRSAATVSDYLSRYPSLKVVLDLHRDAIESPAGNLIKPTAWIGGRKAAQVMIISGCDDGTMDMPGWGDNLRFAAALQSTAEGMYPGLMRPLFFCYRKYNMDLSPGALLIEVGAHGNTLDEASYSAGLLGQALAAALAGE
ncbi:MAG: stage II sporulation protein P [Oscillospiraceae bacterium]|nr:stage II sporulation protein P [Oscillospiraceae bacterium]